MKKFLLLTLCSITFALSARAQVEKVYNETIDPIAQIDSALAVARQSGKFVVAQVGGNWCPWCLRFAQFVQTDTTVAKTVADHFVYIHVNYPRNGAAQPLMERLGRPARFGFPVMVVLDDEGHVLHIQDSSFLEQGQGYDPAKVARFFKSWTPAAVKGQAGKD